MDEVPPYSLQKLIDYLNTASMEAGKSIYLNLILARKRAWDRVYDKIAEYSDRKISPWNINLHKTQEQDLFILEFKPKRGEERSRLFYWKLLTYNEHIIIISFSTAEFWDIRRCLDSFIRCTEGFWYPWIGSKFLENLDLFITSVIGQEATIKVRPLSCYERDKRRKFGIKEIRYPEEWMTFKEFGDELVEDRRKGKFVFLKKIRCYVIHAGSVFKCSISDRAQIMFEPGGSFHLFAELLRPLVDRIQAMQENFRRKMIIKEEKVLVEDKPIILKTIQELQVLTIRPEISNNWFEGFIGLFSNNEELKREGLVSFVLASGNPYFLSHMVDITHGSSVYLSASEEQIRIAPAESITKAETVGTILELVEKFIDPTINVEP